jgi:Na+-translocating ferredoxin:NAD+ oxidoreductase RNF subunit RnfB
MATAVTILLAAGLLLLLAVAMALVLGWANRAFHVHVDPKVAAIEQALPGANCGGCGYVGCADYAQAVAAGKCALNLCGPGGVACVQQLAQIMGMEISEALPYRAVVHCAAHTDQRLPVDKPLYRGEPTCAAANLVADYQGCIYGCLGLGDCVRSCNYDAIHVIDGLAVVDYDNCIGCKACAAACPRNIISMIPFKTDRMLVVACSNLDMGLDVKAVCEIGCIGCSACARKSDAISMHGALPEINYEAYQKDTDFSQPLEKCPRESLVFVGQPSEADLAKMGDEATPDRIEADFRTTVDDTEWWG